MFAGFSAHGNSINTYNSIQHYLFICTQLNSSKDCCVSLTIRQSFVYTQLNRQTIQFNISYLFAHSLNGGACAVMVIVVRNGHMAKALDKTRNLSILLPNMGK